MKNKIAILISSIVISLGAVAVLAASSDLWLMSGNSMYATSTASYVGIGTTNPVSTLHVNGDMRVATWAGIGVSPATNARLMLKAPGSNYVTIRALQSSSNADPIFDVWDSLDSGVVSLYDSADAETVRIHSSGISWMNGGNVGIGTMTPSGILNVVKANATTTVTIGGTNSPACWKLMDKDQSGWTYCTFLDGTIICSTTSCE